MSGYTRARKTYPARTARPTGPRANKFAGNCASCGQNVPAGAGVLTGHPGAWTITHTARRWAGVPCGGDMIGKPGMGRWAGGCPEKDAAEVAPAEVAPVVWWCEADSHPAEPHELREDCERPEAVAPGDDLASYRQRCEDAPCCGHPRCGYTG